jgi:DNA topoisomerase III
MKKLVIAEKPSVARDLATALGKVPKKGDWYENDEYVITSAVGHLVELVMPEDIDKKYRYWRLDVLPIIPEEFGLKPIDKSKSKFEEIKKLLKRKDVDEVINACDAGREGELIFTYLYQLAGGNKPVKRLWLLSMTQTAIRDAFQNLREGEKMRPLADAARCRSESDWLIGINGTRAVTKRLFGSKAGKVATVGRVQTPTLAIVMERERQIRNFVPRTYYRIVGNFDISRGSYEGVFQRADFKKSDDEHDRIDRVWEKERAEEVAAYVRSHPRVEVSEEKKRTTQVAPRLYDLTTLQREANNRFGFSAGQTLRIAQSLYERHKAITYPRTDSRALPEDFMPTTREALAAISGELAPHARKVLENDWVKPNKRIFNNKMVSDHFAIVPTNLFPAKLAADEQKLYDMIARRFIAIFYPVAQFDVTTRFSHAGDYKFKTEGKVLVDPGWMAVYGKGVLEDDAATLCPLDPADGQPPAADTSEINVLEETTKPPPRYTEATLLSAMEGAGKLVEDEELAEAMKEKGLGTPATRANIIDHLIREKYMERQHRELVPSGKAETLLEFLSAVKADALTSPSLTGEWEHKLHQIEEGSFSRNKFMEEISDLTRKIVDRTKNFEEDEGEARVTGVTSPTDGKPMLETLRTYRSQSGDLQIYKVTANRKIDEAEMKELVEKRQVGPLDGFMSRSGKPFSAILKLNDENKVEFVFEGGPAGNGSGEAVDFSTLTEIGTCPKCGGKVYETASAYVCERTKDEEKKCDFRVSRKILGREIDKEQMGKLLTQKKTDLLPQFWSKRSKKPFSAHLILKDGGGIGFEFPPRPPKAPKAAGAKKTKTAGKTAPKEQ